MTVQRGGGLTESCPALVQAAIDFRVQCFFKRRIIASEVPSLFHGRGCARRRCGIDRMVASSMELEESLGRLSRLPRTADLNANSFSTTIYFICPAT